MWNNFMNVREKVAERIQLARKKIGMTQSELAEICGYSRGRLSNWEGATRMPSAQEIHKMAKILKVSPSWLFCVTDDISEYETYSGQLIMAPVLGMTDLIKPNVFDNIADPDKRPTFLKNYNVVALSPDNSVFENPKIFAINISDNSMQPEIRENDLVIINPDVNPVPAQFVLAFYNQQYSIRKYRKPNDTQIELVSINSDWPNQLIDLNSDKFSIIGTVIELRREL